MKTFPLDWLYTVDSKGVVVWSCVSGILVNKHREIVGPPAIVKGLNRLADNIMKGT